MEAQIHFGCLSPLDGAASMRGRSISSLLNVISEYLDSSSLIPSLIMKWCSPYLGSISMMESFDSPGLRLVYISAGPPGHDRRVISDHSTRFASLLTYCDKPRNRITLVDVFVIVMVNSIRKRPTEPLYIDGRD